MTNIAETVKVYVEAPSGERFEADIPLDVTIRKLADDFFENQGWPLHDAKHRNVKVVVELVDPSNPDDTKRLGGNLTIADAGIQEGDTLRIFPESVAGCFLGSVPVILTNKEEKLICDVVVGDALLSMLPGTRQLFTTYVAQVFRGRSSGYITLNGKCQVTESHVIWCNGVWKRAGELKVGDKLLSFDGVDEEVHTIVVHEEEVEVYNLHVTSSQHSFFAGGLLVHNMLAKEFITSFQHDLSSLLATVDQDAQRKRLEDLEKKIEFIGHHMARVEELEDVVEELSFKMEKIAEAFQFLGHYLHKVEFVPKSKTASSPAKTPVGVQIYIDASIDEFNEAMQKKLLKSIAQKTKISTKDIQVVDVGEGSVLVTLEMPEDAASKLFDLYINRDPFISKLRIKKLEVQPLLLPPEALEQETSLAQSSLVKVLFLAANPKETSKLRLEEEVREIDEALLQKSEFRDRFEIIQKWAVRVSDLQAHLLRYQPDIVHFSGHGSSSSEIILEDNNGERQAVSKRALSQLFSTLKDNIRCVVLNACYSEAQAQAIAEHIECVVGMSNAIEDEAAIAFAKSFYQGIGYGRSIDTAFKLGIGQVDLESLGEQDIPQLIAIQGNPKEIIFV